MEQPGTLHRRKAPYHHHGDLGHQTA